MASAFDNSFAQSAGASLKAVVSNAMSAVASIKLPKVSFDVGISKIDAAKKAVSDLGSSIAKVSKIHVKASTGDVDDSIQAVSKLDSKIDNVSKVRVKASTGDVDDSIQAVSKLDSKIDNVSKVRVKASTGDVDDLTRTVSKLDSKIDNVSKVRVKASTGDVDESIQTVSKLDSKIDNVSKVKLKADDSDVSSATKTTKELEKSISSIPDLKIKVDTSAINDIKRSLDGVLGRNYDPISIDIRDLNNFEDIVPNIINTILSGVANLGLGIVSSVSSIPGLIFNIVTAPLKIVVGTIGNILTGTLMGIGETIASDFGNGLVSGIQSKLGDMFGSFNFIGQALGERLSELSALSLMRLATKLRVS
jgi:polyhydroxyalkanoate synthesis regulator phasin